MPNTFSMSPTYVEKFIRENGLKKIDQDVFDRLRIKLARLYLDDVSGPLGKAYHSDAASLLMGRSVKAESVNLVITSPPYPNAYEYWLYHKYRMWWLGFDPLAVKAREIGARAHFFKRQRHTEENFWAQMRQVFQLIDQVLLPRGFACFVIGRSIIHGNVISNADTLQTLAAERRLQPVARIERVLSPHRKSFNLSHANIKTESVLVFQKE